MSALDPRTIETAGLTDVGQVRSVNQDAIGEFELADGQGRLLMVADGMGGHRGGEVASRLAVESTGEVLRGRDPDPDVMADAFQEANARIHKTGAEDRSLAGMGTTGVAILFAADGRAWVAHVGDSRAYRLHQGDIERLTDDHSVVGELVRLGRISADEARIHPQRNEILRAIGTQEQVKVEVQPVDASPGDCFLLCSDGLSTLVTDGEIGEILGAEAPETAARQLVDLANERGGNDNISVQIARLPRPGEAGGGGASETAAGQGGTPRSATLGPRWVWVVAVIGVTIGAWLIVR